MTAAMILSNVYQAIANSEYLYGAVACMAVLQALLSARVKHNTGFTIGLTIASVFMSKHLKIYASHFRALPPALLYALALWVAVLLFIRIRTLRPTAGKRTEINLWYAVACYVMSFATDYFLIISLLNEILLL
jgi:hypothetical protein